jgi:hypothetical protein
VVWCDAFRELIHDRAGGRRMISELIANAFGALLLSGSVKADSVSRALF